MQFCKIWFILIILLMGSSLDAMILFDDPDLALKMIEHDRAYKQTRGKKRLVETRVSVVVVPQVPSEADECSLCFEPYDTVRCTRLALPCDPQRNITHDFCKPCLTDWQKRSNNCPTCQRPFLLEQSSMFTNLLKALSIISCLSCCKDG